MQLLTIIGGLLGVIVIGGAVAFFLYRKTLREAKNYERGLKMVPLLIHLPPLSDDIESGGRDARDVTEETISKAQVLYNIIASTATKGAKSKYLYGQRHIAFEIIAANGVVNYYAAVPIALVSVVEQAITSAYPSARLEEVEEHNLFSEVGKISGTIGGEMVLKKSFAYPIATYQDSKRDVMQSILNSLAPLTKEDGAGIQILLRPAPDTWTKKAQGIASKYRKDRSKGGSSSSVSWKGIGGALWKPPEVEESQGGGDRQLSSLEQATVDSIEEKTRHPGYEILVRIVASSNTSVRSQSILSNIVAAFALFDSQGRNGFKFVPAKVIESFVTAFIFRFFPPEIRQNVLNSVELATLFHFPDQKNTPTSQLQRQASKQVDGPNNVPEHGLLLGYNVFRGIKKAIRLSEDDRRRHMYIIGQTGTGKSWLLKGQIMQDILAGRGLAFIDPHGDAAEDLLGMIPKERAEDVIYFAPGEMDYPVGLNLFEYQYKEQQDFLIQEAINMLYKLYDPQRQGIIGPRYEHLFRNAALTVMAGPDGGTFVDIPKLFNDKQYVNQKLKYVTDQTVLDFWLKEMPGSERSNEFGEVKSWFVSKFGAFLSNQMMRNIIGQTKSGFDLREVMDEGKILLVNLSKGKTGELNAKLLGMIFVMKFYAAAMGRANVPESERRDFTLYVDEFQNFSTETFSDILSEARKYRLSLTVANQFVGQLSEEIRDAVFGNVGTVISSRTGANDAEFLVKYFAPVFDVEDMTKMPNQHWAVQTLLNGVPTQPFSMESARIDMAPNPKLTDALKRLSYAKYGRPKAVVEKEIFDRLKTQEPARPSFAQQPGKYPTSPVGGHTPAAVKPGQSSFLDDWLAKRRKEVGKNHLSSKATMPQKPNPAPHGEASRPPLPPRPADKHVLESDSHLKIDRTRDLAHDPHALSEKPDLQTAHQTVANRPADKKTRVAPRPKPLPLSEKRVEELVVDTGSKRVSTPSTEQNSAVNEAIQGSKLAAGEIAIDNQGVIHYSEHDEDNV